MTREENRKFIRKTESLVMPEDVTAISFLGDFNRLLPKKSQHRIMERGSRKIPYMGFIVDPYAFFLSYRIQNVDAARSMLPDGYDLAESTMFDGQDKHPLAIVSAFEVRTSAFIGMRLELYIIARHRETGKMAWIIADYETDTNSHDPKNGFCGYTSDPAMVAVSPYGELMVEFRGRRSSNVISAHADINAGRMAGLDRELWVEGNLLVDYGGKLKDESSSPFSLIFDPVLMNEAVRLPLESVTIDEFTCLEGLIDSTAPLEAAVFPYSQHFIIRQDLQTFELGAEADLHPQLEDFLQRSGYKTMKGSDIKKPLLAGMVASSLINIGIIVFLVIKAFF